MPLETASTTTPNTYDPPSSSPDPYESTSSNPLPTTIDLSALPHGLPILGPLTGYTTANLSRIILSRISETTRTLARPLTTDEKTTMAYHTAKGHAIASYGPTTGIAFALYRVRATRDEFRWPFYGALKSEELGKGVWDGQTVRIWEREVLKGISVGAKARLLHFLRGSAYVTLGMMVVSPMVSAYGATVSAVGEIRDPRLARVTKELRVVVERNGVQGRRGMGREGAGMGGQAGMGGPMGKIGGRQGGGGARGLDDDDDMSPTGGAFMSDYGQDEEQARLNAMGGGDMNGSPSDDQMGTQGRQAQFDQRNRSFTVSQAGSTYQTQKPTRQPQPQPQPQNFGDDFDAAAPDEGANNDAGGSAWERIRRQNASESNSSAGGRPRGFRREGSQQQDGGSGGRNEEGFSFSVSEGERSFARDEAQREFDQRVEKERRGGDFGGGGWRR